MQKSDCLVLVVDDEEDLGEVLSAHLSDAGFKCEWEQKPKTALQRIANNEVGLLITDLHMPEINGADLVKAMRDKSENTPIIVITGYLNEKHDFHVRDDVVLLNKPFDFSMLLSHVHNLLGTSDG